MPQRPREHEIETESRRAFESALDQNWEYRVITPDYGIDGELEYFEHRKTTGLRFHVQLKGTDTQDHTKWS